MCKTIQNSAHIERIIFNIKTKLVQKSLRQYRMHIYVFKHHTRISFVRLYLCYLFLFRSSFSQHREISVGSSINYKLDDLEFFSV